jgi:hypothetical protein
MVELLKARRLSSDRKSEYQIEYVLNGKESKYKIRRGNYGSFAEWFKTNNMDNMLINCGFKGVVKPNLLHDFYVEAHFGRGYIKLTEEMAKDIAKDATVATMGRYIYSRMKNVSGNGWVLPCSVLTSDAHFKYLFNIIQKNLK